MALTQAACYLRLLFWLKLKLVWRAYTRHLSAAIGAVLAIVFLAPVAAGAAIGCWFGFHLLAPRVAEHLLRGVLLAAYLAWLVFPLIGFALTEDYDIAKLLVYPLSARMIYAGAILGSVIDVGVLLLVPTMLVVLLSFGTGGAAFMVVAAAVGLFVFHTVGLSQAINLATAGVLRSRRGRDILAVAIPLLVSVFYLASQLLPRHLTAGARWSRLLESRTWDLVSYLPPGLAARAIGSAQRGEFLPALAFTLALAALSALTLCLAGWLVQLVYTGEAGSPAARSRPRRGRAAPRPEPAGPKGQPVTRRLEPAVPGRRSWAALLPPAVAAVADKEVKYLFRDPFFKATLSQTVYMLAVVGVMMLGPARFGDEGIRWQGQSWLVWVGTGMLLMAQSQLALNSFGPEGAAVGTLLLFPCPRRQIFIGKNLALFAALSVVNAVFALAVCALARELRLLPHVLAWTALASVIFVACGNIVSVYFPVRVVMRGWVLRRSSSVSLAQVAGHMVVVLVVGLLVLPVLAAVALPIYWLGALWLLATIPMSLAYVCCLYFVSLLLAESALLAREPEVLAALKPEE